MTIRVEYGVFFHYSVIFFVFRVFVEDRIVDVFTNMNLMALLVMSNHNTLKLIFSILSL